jgi:DNA-binding NtrC family response regulator
MCSDSYARCDVLLAVSEPLRVPPLTTRTSELPRIVEEYAEDARAALSTSIPFTQNDRDWVVTHCASSLHEIELATLRLIAIHHAGNVARAAELLGMSHAALGEWFAKRRAKRT